ncbi:MAG: hypothetical protein AAFN77_00330 [Planctomycetota bacterium]
MNDALNDAHSEPETTKDELAELVETAATPMAEVVEDSEQLAPVATIVEPNAAPRKASAKTTFRASVPPPVPAQFQNMAAKGGAVTALILGFMAIVGAFFSPLSAFNGVLGLVFGIWGLTSNLKVISQVGLLLSLVSIVISVFMN